MSRPQAKWVVLRFIAPLAVGSAVTVATWGDRYFDVLTALLWSLFIVHVLATFAFSRTHLLDTGSFFCLIFACGIVAELSEAWRPADVREWSTLAVIYGVYALLSFVGRRRADRSTTPRKSVKFGHVVAVLVFLLVATIVCAGSKTAVGFLFVPGLLLVPVILLFALLTCESIGPDER